MNTYLYARYFNGEVEIKKVVAKGYNECLDKITQYYIDNFDNLDDTAYTNFEDFCDLLAESYDIIIGDIYEINEFM